MPESHARLAIKLESPYGTEQENLTINDCIRVIEPNMSSPKGDEVKFNESWDSRVDAEATRHYRWNRTFSHKAYFYIPRTANECNSVGSYLAKLLLPAHMKTSVGQNFTIDNEFLAGDAINRTGVTLAYQEYVQQEKIIGARNNFKLNFSTAGGMLIELDWLGIDGGTPTNPGTVFPKPPHPGGIINFASANYFIRPLAEQLADTEPENSIKPYLFCKAFTFDYGNQPTLLDDCNEPDGISGVHIGNILDGQKVTFDVTMPANHGSAISNATFPWQKYFKESTLMYWEQTIYGNDSHGEEKGIKLSGVFQITDDPSRSKADGFRRISIGGSSKTDVSGTYEPFKIEIINNSV